MTHCPNCQQALPDPPERFCPSCGADLETGEAAPPRPRAEGTPWERRDRLGFVSALIETTQQVMTAPALFFRRMSPAAGLGGPLLYALIVGYAGAVAAALYSFIANSVMGSSFSRFGQSPELERLLPLIQGPWVLVASLILGPVIVVVEVFIISGLVHLALSLLGGAPRGFEATCRTVCYSEAAALAKIVPFCGGIAAFVWLIVLLTIGLSEVHGTSRGKALAGVVLPFVLFCCCCGAIIGAAFFMGAFAALGQK